MYCKSTKQLNYCSFSFLSAQIQLKIRKSQSGLGAGAALSLDAASVTKSKSQKNWEKARERFADTCQPDVPSPQTPMNKAWVKGEETADTEAGVETEGQSLE